MIIYLSLMIGCAPYSLPENKTYSEKDDPYIYYAESIEAYNAKDYQVALQKIEGTRHTSRAQQGYQNKNQGSIKHYPERYEGMRYFQGSTDQRADQAFC